MGLLDYESFLNESVNESVNAQNIFQFLTQYIGSSGAKSGATISYSDILKDKKFAADEGPLLNEANFFHIFVKNLGTNAKDTAVDGIRTSTIAEHIVEKVLGGQQTNPTASGAVGADSIFSDVSKGDEKISVKASKKAGFSGVLSMSPIKINQILSILFSNGLSSTMDKDKPEQFNKLKENTPPDAMAGKYSIAAVYTSGESCVIEKTSPMDAKTLWDNCVATFKTNQPLDSKYWESLDSAKKLSTLGFSVGETYTIAGLSEKEINDLASVRDVILREIKVLPTAELKDIADYKKINY